MASTSTDEFTTSPNYNILSLDGGGTWALIQAMALGDLYGAQTPGREILKHFHLVVANSGGGLTAAGLWANMTPAQLVEEFCSERVRKEVYTPLSLLGGFPNSLFRSFGIGPKYRTTAKITALRSIIERHQPGLANTPIQTLGLPRGDGEQTHLLLLAYDYNTDRARFLRSHQYSKAGAQKDKEEAEKQGTIEYRTTLVEAIHASSTAPVNYFDDPAKISYKERPISTWDGAIAGYNNPVLAGITEALANGVDRTAIRVLSLGTSNLVLPLQGSQFESPDNSWLVASDYPRSSIFWLPDDLRKLSKSILENPPDVATYVANFMIDHRTDWMGTCPNDPRRQRTNIVRLSPLIQPIVHPGTGKFDVPGWHSKHPDRLNPAEFKRLMELDLDAVGESDVKLIRRFGQLWLEDWVHNQPILADSRKLEVEFGQRWYSQGRARARDIGLVPPPAPARAAAERRLVDDKDAFERALEDKAKRSHPGKARPELKPVS